MAPGQGYAALPFPNAKTGIFGMTSADGAHPDVCERRVKTFDVWIKQVMAKANDEGRLHPTGGTEAHHQALNMVYVFCDKPMAAAAFAKHKQLLGVKKTKQAAEARLAREAKAAEDRVARDAQDAEDLRVHAEAAKLRAGDDTQKFLVAVVISLVLLICAVYPKQSAGSLKALLQPVGSLLYFVWSTLGLADLDGDGVDEAIGVELADKMALPDGALIRTLANTTVDGTSADVQGFFSAHQEARVLGGLMIGMALAWGVSGLLGNDDDEMVVAGRAGGVSTLSGLSGGGGGGSSGAASGDEDENAMIPVSVIDSSIAIPMTFATLWLLIHLVGRNGGGGGGDGTNSTATEHAGIQNPDKRVVGDNNDSDLAYWLMLFSFVLAFRMVSIIWNLLPEEGATGAAPAESDKKVKGVTGLSLSLLKLNLFLLFPVMPLTAFIVTIDVNSDGKTDSKDVSAAIETPEILYIMLIFSLVVIIVCLSAILDNESWTANLERVAPRTVRRYSDLMSDDEGIKKSN